MKSADVGKGLDINTKPIVIMVVGVGRSGTSLVMQALVQIGAHVSQDVVPASKHNQRGAFEALEVRDEMVALHQALDIILSFRPPYWRGHSATRKALSWTTNYLRRIGETAESGIAAVKFPSSSIFLPLWTEAAAAAGVELRLIWATRHATATLESFQRTYNHTLGFAQSRYLQRSYYILRDAPSETLLLPYEGWQDNPTGQLKALADYTGLPMPASDTPLFEAKLNRASAVSDIILDPAIAATDAIVAGKCTTLRAALPQNTAEVTNHLGQMVAAMQRLSPSVVLTRKDTPMTTQKFSADTADTYQPLEDLQRQLITTEDIVTQLTKELQQSQAAVTRAQQNTTDARNARNHARDHAEKMTQASDELAEKLEESDTEVARHKAAYEALTLARDRDTEAMQIEIGYISGRNAENERKLALRQERLAQLEKAQARLQKLPPELKKAKAENRKLLASKRWQAGELVSRAVRRPGLRTLALPIRLIQLARRKKN